MKKLVLVMAIVLFFITNAVCMELKSEEKKPDGGLCPITKIAGRVDDCFKCHVQGNFKVIETNYFATWDLPYGATMAMINGEPVCFYDITGFVGGNIGSKIDEIFVYLHSTHPEVKKWL
jgi:hypothetical protein